MVKVTHGNLPKLGSTCRLLHFPLAPRLGIFDAASVSASPSLSCGTVNPFPNDWILLKWIKFGTVILSEVDAVLALSADPVPFALALLLDSCLKKVPHLIDLLFG